LFLLLIDRVSGIGPAIAMAVLSGMPVDHFKACVVKSELPMLGKLLQKELFLLQEVMLS